MGLGDAYIDVHANTDPFDRELDRNLIPIIKGADKDFEAAGKQWGETLADSTAKEVKKHGKDFGDSIENATKGRIVKTRFGFRNLDTGRWAKGVADDMVHEVGRAFSDAGRPGGPFSFIGRGIADAIGAGFNVSGKSPLIALLVPAIGALVALILAAVQAVNALIAALTAVPALVAAIGFQVGVLFLAFDGLGTAIQGAFAAKNPKELAAALKGLTPAARTFVMTLLPLESLFKQLKEIAQQNFFKALGPVIQPLLTALSPTVLRGTAVLATALGGFFRALGAFFASPTFVKFVSDVFPSTARFLKGFAGPFVKLVDGIIAIATTALPFLEEFGERFGDNLGLFADKLVDLAKDPAFRDWLDRMLDTFFQVVELFAKATIFVASFMTALDKAGGDKLIKEFADAFEKLAFFLSTPLGQKAMEGLVDLLIILTRSFVGLVLLVLAIIGYFELLAEAWKLFWQDLKDFWAWIKGTLWPGIIGFFGGIHLFFKGLAEDAGHFVGVWRDRIIAMAAAVAGFFVGWYLRITGIIATVRGFIATTFNRVRDDIIFRFNQVVAWVRGLPNKLLGALGDIVGAFYRKGQSIMENLIAGLRSKLHLLEAVANVIVSILDRVIPGSPAEIGPFSGHGAPELRGQRIVQDLIKGLNVGLPALQGASMNMANSIVFGPNSVRVGFEGALPTEDQARTTGRAAGLGITDILAKRNTALAVRTL